MTKKTLVYEHRTNTEITVWPDGDPDGMRVRKGRVVATTELPDELSHYMIGGNMERISEAFIDVYEVKKFETLVK